MFNMLDTELPTNVEILIIESNLDLSTSTTIMPQHEEEISELTVCSFFCDTQIILLSSFSFLTCEGEQQADEF